MNWRYGEPPSLPLNVDVYRNLNNDCISVKSRESSFNNDRVILHADTVWLKDVEFVVSDSQRKKARREDRRNVHAYARGQLINGPIEGDFSTHITYYPFDDDDIGEFIYVDTGEIAQPAPHAKVTTGGVFIETV